MLLGREGIFLVFCFVRVFDGRVCMMLEEVKACLSVHGIIEIFGDL